MNNIIKKKDHHRATLGSVVDQLFQTNLDRVPDDHFWGFNGLRNDSHVPVNIRETDAAYELELVAPGLKREDFRLSCDRDTLTISFEHKEDQTSGGQAKWIHREHRASSFSRTFTIDNTVDVDKAAARYENGILLLTLPKKEDARRLPRTINVQ